MCNTFLPTLICLLLLWLGATQPNALAQVCSPPDSLSIELQNNVQNDSGQPVDSIYVQWTAPASAGSYYFEVWVNNAPLFSTYTANTQVNFSLLPTGWDILEIRLKTLCNDGTESITKTTSIVATVDEVYKIYQDNNCNETNNACSICLCQALESLLENNTTPNDTIDNTEFLGAWGCAGFLNRFLQFNNNQLQLLCPCYVPKDFCYDTYPCNGYNCTTGLREVANEQYLNWRVQNNTAKGNIVVEYTLPKPYIVNIVLYDYLGRVIQSINPSKHAIMGLHANEIEVPKQGIYLVELQVNDKREVKKVIAIW